MAKTIANSMFGITGMLAKPFGSDSAPAPAATPAATPVMPIADDAKVQQARKRAIAAQLQRGGRSSTILSTNSDTLGN